MDSHTAARIFLQQERVSVSAVSDHRFLRQATRSLHISDPLGSAMACIFRHLATREAGQKTAAGAGLTLGYPVAVMEETGSVLLRAEVQLVQQGVRRLSNARQQSRPQRRGGV